ncbi:insoluble matrix shell protein 2-like [Mercenaria mercenaria]|uniref:insoluble matrix shell protein 2-like n=1 Tax=Mercenaria mercenaria TaxID=6596 RepID=UPI00234F3C8F|nr:insoluble matrix shell protein 2-like [Mercenaria mercenaria]
MHQSILRVLVLSSLVCFCACLHVAYDLNGWKAVPLDNRRVVDSMILAAAHLGGEMREPVTAFKWSEGSPDWDLYRVSFKGIFLQGKGYECHADAVWITNPANTTVFNTGGIPIPLNQNLRVV